MGTCGDSMPEANANSEVKKIFDSVNKNLYRTNKVQELYKPLAEILRGLSDDIKRINDLQERNSHLEQNIEDEIKKRELISLYKKMDAAFVNIKEEMDYFYKEIKTGDKLFEKYRAYRTYIFETADKSYEFMQKLITSFGIEEFVLKFNVVGTIDLNDISQRINGRKTGIDIIIPSSNLKLVYDEILKSKGGKFRLITDTINIYFEKDNVLYIEAPSTKIKICDADAQTYGAKLLDN